MTLPASLKIGRLFTCSMTRQTFSDSLSGSEIGSCRPCRTRKALSFCHKTTPIAYLAQTSNFLDASYLFQKHRSCSYCTMLMLSTSHGNNFVEQARQECDEASSKMLALLSTLFEGTKERHLPMYVNTSTSESTSSSSQKK